MISLSIICTFVSVYCLIAISKKVEMSKGGLLSWLEQRRNLAIAGACIFGVVSIVLLALQYGLARAIFADLVLWPVVACLIIIVAPFEKVNWMHLSAASVLFLLIEVMVF